MHEFYGSEAYFAASTPDQVIDYLHNRAALWFNYYIENNYLYKLKRSWEAYHGSYYLDGHKVSYGGEQGELVNLPVNHYRNIATNMLNMVTANRPAFQARSTNLDSKSEVQTNLANGLLEYYMREKRLERFLKKAVEYAIVFGSGYIKMNWNSTSGKIYDYIEPESPTDAQGRPAKAIPVYEGDLHFLNLSPFDVIFDTSKDTYEEQQWILCRSFVNKFDLAAKYPELAEKILEVKTKTDIEARRFFIHPYDESMDIPLYEFMHISSEAVPNGRYLVYVNEDVILSDTNMPYRGLPVFRISTADFLGAPFGYTPMFDLIPLQTAVNSLYSTILTNQNAFGVQSIINPRGNDVRVHQIEAGMNFIEYNSQFGKPEALQLTSTPQEVFGFLQMLERAMETISGINSVARGNPDISLKSGNALALIQAQALQFISNLQQNYIQLIEDVGTGVINTLKDFASVPRIAAIVGINNRTKMTEFTGDDLSTINRVLVDVGNPLAQTTAGRVQMAEQLLQMKLINTPEKYIEVMNTGKLTAMTDDISNVFLTIRAENEHLMKGDIEIRAIFTDAHAKHIQGHASVLDDPHLRLENPELVQRLSAHMMEHYQLLQNTDPQMLAILGQQAISPMGGNPVVPETMAAQMPPAGAEGTSENLKNIPSAGVGAGINAPIMPNANPTAQLPQPAQPAQPKQGATAAEIPLSGR